jgi:hypothetical protein
MNAVMIYQGAQLIGTLVPLAIDAALKIKLLLEQGNDYRVEIREMAQEAVAVNDETLLLIEAWRKQNGL